MLSRFTRKASIYNDEHAVAKIPFFFNYCVVPRTVLDVLKSYLRICFDMYVRQEPSKCFSFVPGKSNVNTSSTLDICPFIY